MLVLLSSIALLVLLLTYFKHIRTLFYVEGDCTVTASLYTIQVRTYSSILLSTLLSILIFYKKSLFHFKRI